MTTQRITEKQLDRLAEILNEMTGSPKSYMSITTNDDGTTTRTINVGHFHISHAYGGVCLHRTCNAGGGVTTPLISYHAPKRELYNAMQAYRAGLEAVKYGEVAV